MAWPGRNAPRTQPWVQMKVVAEKETGLPKWPGWEPVLVLWHLEPLLGWYPARACHSSPALSAIRCSQSRGVACPVPLVSVPAPVRWVGVSQHRCRDSLCLVCRVCPSHHLHRQPQSRQLQRPEEEVENSRMLSVRSRAALKSKQRLTVSWP